MHIAVHVWIASLDPDPPEQMAAPSDHRLRCWLETHAALERTAALGHLEVLWRYILFHPHDERGAAGAVAGGAGTNQGVDTRCVNGRVEGSD